MDWSFESWNFETATHLKPSMTSVTEPVLKSLCKQAKAARILNLPAFVLACLLIAIHLWVGRLHKYGGGGPAPSCIRFGWDQTKLESQSQESESEGSPSDYFASPVSPISPIDAYEGRAEMPDRQMMRAELPVDASIKKMMGETGHKELAAGDVAVEKSGNETNENA